MQEVETSTSTDVCSIVRLVTTGEKGDLPIGFRGFMPVFIYAITMVTGDTQVVLRTKELRTQRSTAGV